MPGRLIKRIKDALVNKPNAPAEPPRLTATLIPRSEHAISRKQINSSALKVLYRLNDAGHEAYLVGGSVRDLMLGIQPKDFDVATSAHPEEVERLFSNCMLIGRRFRLAHVRFGKEIIEVATFRASAPEEKIVNHSELKKNEHNRQVSVKADSGMLLRDNVYGSVEEDAARRDFTINAIYYSVKDFAVHDYANGVADIQAKKIRLIGEPVQRYREDPVRMLRAARFAAKLDFSIAKESADPIPALAETLLQVPPARLFEEVQKLFLSGHALKTYHILCELQLFKFLFPAVDSCANHNAAFAKMVEIAMRNSDIRIAEEKHVTPAFLFAVLLWGPLMQQWARHQEHGIPAVPALQKAAQDVLNKQNQHTSIPKRFSIPIREIWDLQARLDKRHGGRAFALFNHPRFRAAYDFLLLREEAGELPEGLGSWWTEYQEVDETERRKMVEALKVVPKKKPRRRKPKPNVANAKPGPIE